MSGSIGYVHSEPDTGDIIVSDESIGIIIHEENSEQENVSETPTDPEPMPMPDEMLHFLWIHADRTDVSRPCYINYVEWPHPYMHNQTDIKPKMRHILIDWLWAVCRRHKMHRDVMHMACWLLDRFLCKRLVSLQKLQLVGCSALWIASKTEMVWGVSMDEIIELSDNAFDRSQLKDMEAIMLNTINFNLAHHTMIPFNVFQFLDYCQCPIRDQVTRYLWDASLVEYSCVHINKITILCACVLVAKLLVRRRRLPKKPDKYVACWKVHNMDQLVQRTQQCMWSHRPRDIPDFQKVTHQVKFYPLLKYGLIIRAPPLNWLCCQNADASSNASSAAAKH